MDFATFISGLSFRFKN